MQAAKALDVTGSDDATNRFTSGNASDDPPDWQLNDQHAEVHVARLRGVVPRAPEAGDLGHVQNFKVIESRHRSDLVLWP